MKAFLKKYSTLLITIFFCSGTLWLAYGCEPKTPSIIYPTKKVNFAELQIELETLVQIYNLRINDLEKKEQLREWFFNQAAEFVETGNANPIGVLTSLFSVLGIGAGADNLRIRKKLKNVHITEIADKKNA